MATPFINFFDLAAVAVDLALVLEEASDVFAVLTEAAAAMLNDCPAVNSIIAKPIITMKTSLVVFINVFSQVEVMEAFFSQDEAK
ncbi:hypothetical protein [Desulfobulbus propionicus]|uniref:hypothetical protein n=1 Tax=Desulfobulbus propionicus TaxID=894 RepID=UPI00146E1FAA|nr:hypothetical protein [Desulfobulbus propionicus]